MGGEVQPPRAANEGGGEPDLDEQASRNDESASSTMAPAMSYDNVLKNAKLKLKAAAWKKASKNNASASSAMATTSSDESMAADPTHRSTQPLPGRTAKKHRCSRKWQAPR